MLTILDIGIGNIGSITNVLKHLGIEFQIAKNPEDINTASKIIFPGVGSYFEGSKILHEEGFIEIIHQKVLQEKIPILGICLGMQLLSSQGFEHGSSKGLDLIEGQVQKIQLEDKNLVIPHMGWNEVISDSTKLYSGVNEQSCFYFVHSFECKISDPAVLVNYTNHGRDIVASFSKDNIYGVQFHPEKSQDVGLKLLRNFVELC